MPCGTEAVLKVQYPGVADSIESDLSNLQWLIAPLAPRGLFIENIIRVAREELAEECDYECEARYQQRYQALVQQSGLDDVFLVPRVHEDLARRTVLATDFVDGTPFESLLLMPQEERNRIARAMLELTVRELQTWAEMRPKDAMKREFRERDREAALYKLHCTSYRLQVTRHPSHVTRCRRRSRSCAPSWRQREAL